MLGVDGATYSRWREVYGGTSALLRSDAWVATSGQTSSAARSSSRWWGAWWCNPNFGCQQCIVRQATVRKYACYSQELISVSVCRVVWSEEPLPDASVYKRYDKVQTSLPTCENSWNMHIFTDIPSRILRSIGKLCGLSCSTMIYYSVSKMLVPSFIRTYIIYWILTSEPASHTPRVGSGRLRNADRVLASHVLGTGRLALLDPQVGYVEWRRRQVVRAHLMSQRAAAIWARDCRVVWFQPSALTLVYVIQHFIQDLWQTYK